MRHWRKCQLSANFLMVLISQSFGALDPAISRGGAVQRNCSDSEYWNSAGFCCDKCHPGFKLKKVCLKSGTRSTCVPCENGTYIDSSNYSENCFSCQDCRKQNAVVKAQCKRHSNSVCECESGYYMNIIDKPVFLTWKCVPCNKCGPNQLRTGECVGQNNTKCQCKEKHYPVDKFSCKPCVECRTDGCEYLCTSSTPSNVLRSDNPTKPTNTLPEVLVPVCACITVLGVGLFMVYEGIRLWRKRQMALSPQLSLSHSEVKFEDKPMIVTMSPDTESVPFTNQPCKTEPCRELPDCVPREIKTHEFFYFVLDEVPVGRFRELVRRLGVSEQEIERAERDHRSFKDAQYQMLKVWGDSGNGGVNNILSCHLIQIFLDILKTMYLAGCADSIENKFLSQDRSSSH